MEILLQREQGIEFPLIPEAEEGNVLLKESMTEGLIIDGKTFPVLYRVKTLFGFGAKLESVHIETALPDRLDLQTISIDKFAINIVNEKRGFNVTQLMIGDLVWVYHLVPKSKFAKSNLAPLADLREANDPYSATVWRVHRFAFIQSSLKQTIGYVVGIIKTKKETALKVYMNDSRALVTINKSGALNEQEFLSLKKNDFISALYRDPQLPYMVFCCSYATLEARRELRAHMVDVIYIPPPPQAPLRVTRALELF